MLAPLKLDLLSIPFGLSDSQATFSGDDRARLAAYNLTSLAVSDRLLFLFEVF